MTLYYMTTDHRHFLCFGDDAVSAAENIMREFGVREEDISVQQHILLDPSFAKEIDFQYGGGPFWMVPYDSSKELDRVREINAMNYHNKQLHKSLEKQ